MERFIGTWKLEDTEGDPAVLAKLIGLPVETIAKRMNDPGLRSDIRQKFSEQGGAYVFCLVFTSSGMAAVEEVTFTLDEPLLLDDIDGNDIKTVFRLNRAETILTETRRTSGGPITVSSELINNYCHIIKTIESEGATFTERWSKCSQAMTFNV